MADDTFTASFPSQPRRDSDYIPPSRHALDAMSEPFSWQLPTSPINWPTYHRLINEELAQNDQREFGVKQEKYSFEKREFGVKQEECSFEKREFGVKQEEYSFEKHAMDPSLNILDTKSEKWEDDVESRSGPSSHGGYMSKTSPFSLDQLTPDMSFLEWYPKGCATISYFNDLGDIESVGNLSPWIIEQRSLLLSEAFEYGPSGPRLHLEAVTSSTIRPFLQFLYTGAYILPTPSGESLEDVPTSLLIHCQLYRLGDIYDLQELKSLANVGVLRQCEFGCSSPDKPIDLCAAIEYVYQNMPEHAGLIDTIINYCVTCFLPHGLENDIEFRRMAFDLRPFHQDLCKISMGRGFEDEPGTAQAIIRLPFKPYVPETYASREDGQGHRAIPSDEIYRFHGEDAFENSHPKRKRPEMTQGPAVSGITLALRQKWSESCKEEAVEGQDEAFSSHPKKRLLPHDESEDVTESTNDANQPFCEATSTSLLDNAETDREPTRHLNSDIEYEMIPGPAPVETLSSDSSDSDDSESPLVVVNWSSSTEAAAEASGLPIRPRGIASSLTAFRRRDSDGSDSEWDMI